MLRLTKRPKKGDPYFAVFRSDSNKKWYWHLRGGNHKIMTASEGYESKAHAIRALERFKEIVNSATIKIWGGK